MHECDAVLVQDVRVESLHRTQQIAWLSLVTEKMLTERRQDVEAGMSVLGIDFDGSYKEFVQARREYLNRRQFSFSEDVAFSLFTSSVSDAAMDAWVQCIKSKNFVGAKLMLRNYDKNAVVVEFYYKPSQGPAKKERLEVQVTGGTVPDKLPKILTGEQRFTWIISRNGVETLDFRITVNVGEGAATADLRIPSYVPPAPPSAVEPIWRFLTPKTGERQLIGETRKGEFAYLVMAGKWCAWASGNEWWPPERCCMQIVAQDRTTGQLRLNVPYALPYIKVPGNASVYVVVGDSNYDDNRSLDTDPLRAALFVGEPPTAMTASGVVPVRLSTTGGLRLSQ